MERPAGDPGMGYLCSPNVGDFRLTLDGGRNGDGVQRYLSDGQTRIPYRLQVFTGQGERLRANRVLSISLPEGVSSLMLQAFNTPVADMPPAEVGSPSDTVLATFEY
ncbi:hypothetical protein GCM10010082_18350 [Kushneria pakistanensis]|uniref:Spore coat protein U domain-containing protein n=2 Tax=Kushneria pakistanensis TaxID=1508770 RepID=A0ABQ3FJH3_9GAMM|nr:hypothetical protein GCM10010082_18350 [Kushneria pakistanensis]